MPINALNQRAKPLNDSALTGDARFRNAGVSCSVSKLIGDKSLSAAALNDGTCTVALRELYLAETTSVLTSREPKTKTAEASQWRRERLFSDGYTWPAETLSKTSVIARSRQDRIGSPDRSDSALCAA